MFDKQPVKWKLPPKIKQHEKISREKQRDSDSVIPYLLSLRVATVTRTPGHENCSLNIDC